MSFCVNSFYLYGILRTVCYECVMISTSRPLEASLPSESQTVAGAQTLMRGIDVLMAIGTASEPPRFRDLQVGLGIPKGTLHRLLAGLQARNLVRFDERTRRYHTGHRILDLARHTLDQSEIRRATKPELSRLSRQLGQAICLYILEGNHVFVLDFEDPDAAQARTVRLWPRLPADDSAPGLALLAGLDPEDRKRILGERHEALASELGLIRALGYSLNRSARDRQSAVAAVVTDGNGAAVAAITCHFDAFSGTAEELHSAGRMVAEGARRASSNFGAPHYPAVMRSAPQGPPDESVVNLMTGRDFMGENPIWCARTETLYWLDILAPALRIYHPGSGRTGRVVLPEITGGLALAKDGQLMLLGQRGLFSYAYPDGEPRLLISPERGKPDNRFNTASVDDDGAIWAATMAINQRPGTGSLYRISADLHVQEVTSSLGLAKNVSFSPDRSRLYISDGEAGAIYCFDYDNSRHRIGERKAFVTSSPELGMPNGIAVDCEGYVWVAMLGGWTVNRYAPDGRLDRAITLPVPMPTAVGFGGADMKTLYITSTYLRLPPGFSAAAPLSGQVFALECSVPGQPNHMFGAG
jgi:sugar lactone lactonase YvrE/DNA-binding IclR family transcriptional regulator